jgi:hypothetical protein
MGLGGKCSDRLAAGRCPGGFDYTSGKDKNCYCVCFHRVQITQLSSIMDQCKPNSLTTEIALSLNAEPIQRRTCPAPALSRGLLFALIPSPKSVMFRIQLVRCGKFDIVLVLKFMVPMTGVVCPKDPCISFLALPGRYDYISMLFRHSIEGA